MIRWKRASWVEVTLHRLAQLLEQERALTLALNFSTAHVLLDLSVEIADLLLRGVRELRLGDLSSLLKKCLPSLLKRAVLVTSVDSLGEFGGRLRTDSQRSSRPQACSWLMATTTQA